MKILCVEPGPTHSTIDVYNGIAGGLRECGHQVGSFALHNRLEHANFCLGLRAEAADAPRPTDSDVIFHASGEVVQYALYHEVDWVLFVACGLVHPAVYIMLRRAHVPTCMILTESPYVDEQQAEIAALVDVVWTNERTSVARLSEANPRTYYLPHAYDPEMHYPGPSDWISGEDGHDVIFVGTLWQERIDLLADVDWTGINLGIYGSADLFNFDLYPSEHNQKQLLKLHPFMHVGFVSNARTVQLYRSAKIGINLHRTSVALGAPERIKTAESMNPRCYEQAATGGALLVTDPRQEVREIFKDQAPLFTNASDLEEQIRYHLYDDYLRQDLVGALRHAVTTHTFAARAAQITDNLSQFERSSI